MATVLITGITFETCNLKSKATNLNKQDTVDLIKTSKQELIETDKAFAKCAKEKGFDVSFKEFSANKDLESSLRKNPFYLKIKTYNKQDAETDSLKILTWKPEQAEVSQSCDMGYTKGTYKLCSKKNANQISIGTYTTTWQKQNDNTWKWIAHAVN